jgi:hypothetical protein
LAVYVWNIELQLPGSYLDTEGITLLHLSSIHNQVSPWSAAPTLTASVFLVIESANAQNIRKTVMHER